YRGFVHASTPGQVDRAVSGRDPRRTRGHPRGGVRKSSDFETPRTRFTSFLHWRIERALDLDDVVLVQAMDLDDGAGRIGALTPKLSLDLIDDRPEAVHIGRIDDEPHGVAKARALGFRNQLHVQKSLADAGFVALDERIGFGVDAAHSSHVDEVAGAVGLMAPVGDNVFTPLGETCWADAEVASNRTTTRAAGLIIWVPPGGSMADGHAGQHRCSR